MLYAKGVPAGMAELDRREVDEIRLTYCGITPEYIGRGLGKYLLQAAIEIAWSYGPKRFWLNTNTLDHPRALGFYQRMGFTVYKQETGEFVDPRLTGLIGG